MTVIMIIINYQDTGNDEQEMTFSLNECNDVRSVFRREDTRTCLKVRVPRKKKARKKRKKMENIFRPKVSEKSLIVPHKCKVESRWFGGKFRYYGLGTIALQAVWEVERVRAQNRYYDPFFNL